MTSSLSHRPDKKISWADIYRLARTHKPKLISAHFMALLATMASVPIPLLMPLLVDEILLNKPDITLATLNQLLPSQWHSPPAYILTILVMSLLLRLASTSLAILQSRSFFLISKDIIFHLRCRLIQTLQTVSMKEYETLGSGRVVTHLVTDLETLDTFIGSTISKLLISVLSITGIAIILLWIHWQLGLFILLLNPIVIYFTRLAGKRIKALKANEITALSIFQQSLTDTLEAIHQIRASNRDQHYFSELKLTAETVKITATSFAWKNDAANRLSFIIFLFGFDIFRALSMLMVLYSGLSIGQMLAVFGYLWLMMGPIQEILGIQYAYFSAKAALLRLNNISDLKQEPVIIESKNPFANTHTSSLTIENLHFHYNASQPILKGVNLHIPAGHKVALVGASGGGKSTLIQILIGLYPTTQGNIYYDGVPMNQIGLNTIRENVVTVLQNPILFNDTIRANLTLGRDCPDADLWKALEISQLKSTVKGLNLALETPVGRQGLKLSGGQRQRLAIARMILSNPNIVILDEATSALDSQIENDLHNALKEFLQNRTTIIIAHRLSAVKQADHVYVFDNGQICQQGHPETLIKQEGLYAQLYGE